MIRKLLTITALTAISMMAVHSYAAESSVMSAPIPQNESQQDQTEKDAQVWNLKDVDLRTVAYEVSKATGKNFIIGPKIEEKVSFITSSRLPKEELYQAFIALLHAYGYAAIPEGDVIKIVSGTSRNELRPTLKGENADKHSLFELRTIRVQNYPVLDMVRIIKPLIPQYSYVDSYKPSNDLIIADHASHINEMIDLVHRLDRPSTKDFDMIHLKYATADELVKPLSDLISATKSTAEGPDQNVKIVADPRSNSLMISGARFSQLQELHSLIARLDVPDDAANERTDVVFLKYLPAETFAPIINGLVESYIKQEEYKTGKQLPSDKDTATGAAATTTAATRPSMTGQFNLQNPMANFSGGSSGSNAGGNPNVNAGGNVGSYAAEPPKSGTLSRHVQWEQSTNSIIITAPGAVIRRVRSVVNQLDIRRPQVLIEAVIAEIDVDHMKELGVEWGNLTSNQQLNTRFSPTLPLSEIGKNGNYSAGGIPDMVGQGLSFGVFHGMTLRLLVRALSSNSDNNVLATPNIVTLDNEPALIKVGLKVSFTIGQIVNNPTGGNPFNSFDREDVGLVLSIKPQITPNGSIRLNITQELSSLIPNTAAQNLAGQNPTTSERFIQTTVMADNDQILVLGGLLQKQFSVSTSKVPIIGDIPFIGAMFKNRFTEMHNTNLMIFLHPVILYDPKDSEMVSNGKYEYLRQSQIHLDKYGERDDLNPVTPILQRPVNLPEPLCEGNTRCWSKIVTRGVQRRG